MAEDSDAAGAAERLEQALNRIAAATRVHRHDAQHAQSKVDTLAERLDLMIAELRAALDESGGSPSAG